MAPVGVKFLLRFVHEMPPVLFTTRINQADPERIRLSSFSAGGAPAAARSSP